MSHPDPEPRINSQLLDKYKGSNVRLTAKIIKVDGDTMTVESSDGGMHMHTSGKYIEIIGLVDDDLTVKALHAFDFGDSLDLKAVNAVVEFGQSHKGQGVFP